MRNSHQSKRGRTWITYEIVETVVICFISRIRCQRFCDKKFMKCIILQCGFNYENVFKIQRKHHLQTQM